MSFKDLQLNRLFFKSLLVILLTIWSPFLNAQTTSVHWDINSLSQIGGNNVQVIGNPQIIDTDLGNAVEFDGIDDGLIINNNPMAGVSAFTVEIIFKPYSDGGTEQRFLHFQQDDNNRILIELRNNSNANWSLDTFIKSGSSSKTLLDYSFVHDLNTWTHAALIYKDGMMKHYVNGDKELESDVVYQVVNSGQTSLGMRLNQVSWFKGAIRAVKVTNEALNPEDFMVIEPALGVKNIHKAILTTQISPNPLVSSSLLKYQLQKSSKLSIKILNVLGEEVANLFEDFKSAGIHELEINRNNLKAGLYFLVINHENGNSIKKIIISN
ncbi:LamG-like jellyroll fold domain-containing protein [Mariniflexile sp. HNIBRBA6329]|uniref:LamG-like jellyroll fold domain-containing protein n=1 Tax=Mariniflexile sp. HNIBRBA6329 TaxID=3373088 RepID=UPI003745EB1D